MTLGEWKQEKISQFGLPGNNYEFEVVAKKTQRAFVQGEGNTGEPLDMAMVAIKLGNQIIKTFPVDVPDLEDGNDFFDVQSQKLASEKARADALAAENEKLKADIAAYESELSDEEA